MKNPSEPGLLPAEAPVEIAGEGAFDGVWVRMRRLLRGDPTINRRFMARAGVLFLALCVVKAVMLGGLGKHLFQSHWRVSGQPPEWFGQVGFWLFLALGLTTLLLLGRSAAVWTKRELRGTNAAFVITGGVFVFLSFHTIGNNYLQPLANGTLKPADIWHYFELNLFYGEPFLAGWLLGYALLYWALARQGREHWTLPMLGVMAVVYFALNLRELMERSNALAVANCLGLAALAGWASSRRALNWQLQLLPLALAAAAWLLMVRFDAALSEPGACFILLACVALALFVPVFVLGRHGVGHPLMSHFLPFYFVAFLLLSNHHAPFAANYNLVLINGLTLARYLAGDFFVCAALLLGAMVTARRFPRMAAVVFDTTAVALILVALVDLKLTQTMAIRLDWNAIVVANNPLMLWRTIEPFAIQAAFGLVLLVTAYLGLTRLGVRWLGARAGSLVNGRAGWPGYGPVALVLLAGMGTYLVENDKAVGTALGNVAVTSPLLRGTDVEKLGAREFAELSARLGFTAARQAAATFRPAGPPADLNVFLVVMESSHTRYLSLFGAEDETQPLLKKYRDRMELFPDFWSNFPNSFHARFITLNGLLAPKEYVTYLAPRIPAPNLFEVLKANGWTNSAFDSCSRDYVRWNDYLGHRGLDVFHDCDSMPGREKYPKVSWGVSENATLDAITNRIAFHAQHGGKFSLAYLPVAPHMPFDSPTRASGFDKFNSGFGQLDGNFVGRYKNQLLYLDWVITTMIESLEANGLLDKTLVVITNDHGEMLGEDAGKLGHGWSLDPRLCNSPLIIMDPRRRGYRVNPTRGSQPDLLPTILDRLNVEVPRGELYQGVSLDSDAAKQPRPIWFNSYRHRAMITGSQFIVEENGLGHKHGGGPVRVFDILNEGVKTSFKETDAQADVAAKFNDLERYQKSLLVHYAYYRDLAAKLAPRDSLTQAAAR